MKTKPKQNRILAVFMSMLMVFMCITSASVQATAQKMTFRFNKMDVSAGQDIQLDVIVANAIAVNEVKNLIIAIPDGFTVTGMSDTSPAFNGTVDYSVNGNYLNFSISSNGTLSGSNVAATINMHVDENCEQKNYMFQWTTTAMSCILANDTNYTPQFTFGIVAVGEGGSVQTTEPPITTTTTTTTTIPTTTTTTTPEKYRYSVKFVDEETGQAVSGVKYGVSTYAQNDDIDHTTKTSGNEPYYFETVQNKVVISLTIDNPLPDGYYTTDNANNWNISANNPDLTVYLRKAETTTTTTTTPTTTTTTYTTTSVTYQSTTVTYPLSRCSISFIDKDTGEYVSGVEYSINAIYGTQISGYSPYHFAFIGSFTDISLISLPDGYYVTDGATHWTLSFYDPDLTVYLRKAETTTNTEITTTTTTTTVSANMEIIIDSYPTKTAYTVGEELDLSGGKFYSKIVWNNNSVESSKPADMAGSNYVDASEFDNTKAGIYKIYIRMSSGDMNAETFFEVTVKNTYSVQFVDEETGQIISGVRYTIVSYDYAHDLAVPVQTSGDTPKTYEFISDTAYVKLTTEHEQSIPDGYALTDSTERWELSADNPNLTVYLRKGETTTTTEITTTTTETTTTTTETTTTTTETTTTTWQATHVVTGAYSISFIDQDTGNYVSGVEIEYNNSRISVNGSYYFPFSVPYTSDTYPSYPSVSISLVSLPDGYYVVNGSTYWTLSYYYPDLKVYLRKAETTTTMQTTTTTTMTTTETTTTKIHFVTLNLEITELPNKTVYQIGEELDLTGIKYSITGTFSNGANGGTTKQPTVDTSEFDSTKAGTYKIYASIEIDDLRAEDYFEVTVTETEVTTISTYMEVVIESYPTKTAYAIGEELDLSGGTYYVSGCNRLGNYFKSDIMSMDENRNNIYSHLDSTKVGTYKIYIRVSEEGMTAENSFDVTVYDDTIEYSLGDINKDGQVNAIDASLISMEYALLSTNDHVGKFTEEQNAIADLNKDGQINALDASLVAMYYAYLSTGDVTEEKDSIDVWLANKENSSVLENESEITDTTTTTTVSQEQLDSALKRLYEDEQWYAPYYCYEDTNNDGIPELFVDYQSMAGEVTYLYVYKNGEFINTGKWSHQTYVCNEKNLIRMKSEEGADVDLLYTVENDGSVTLVDSLSTYVYEYYHGTSKISESEYNTRKAEYDSLSWTELKYQKWNLV